MSEKMTKLGTQNENTPRGNSYDATEVVTENTDERDNESDN